MTRAAQQFRAKQHRKLCAKIGMTAKELSRSAPKKVPPPCVIDSLKRKHGRWTPLKPR